MKSFSIALLSALCCAVGVSMGMLMLWLVQARPPATTAASATDLRPLQAQVASLRTDLAASRAKIAALEASAAAARLASGTRRFLEARPEPQDGPADFNRAETQPSRAEPAQNLEAISVKPPDHRDVREGEK